MGCGVERSHYLRRVNRSFVGRERNYESSFPFRSLFRSSGVSTSGGATNSKSTYRTRAGTRSTTARAPRSPEIAISSGTNELAGAVREELQPASWAAGATDPTAKINTDRSRTAANIGGPIWRDHIFGYASGRYEKIDAKNRTNFSGPVPDEKQTIKSDSVEDIKKKILRWGML